MARRKRSGQSPVAIAAAAGSKPPALAWRLGASLSGPERRKLALRLIEDDAEEITFRSGGFRWTGFAWDRVVTGNLFAHGSFQHAEMQAVIAWMKNQGRLRAPRDTIVDAGAHIGTTAIPFARQTGCRVLAIEPVPEIFAMLCRNIAANALSKRITPIQAAISAGRTKRVRMALPEENSGAAEVVRPGHKPSFAAELAVRRRMQVPATGLAALLEAHRIVPGCVAFVWADVQGAECDVIETGVALWRAGVPLFAEVDPKLWPNAGDPRAFLRLARRHFSGFVPVEALIADARPLMRKIADLPSHCRALGTAGSDVLLLP